MERVKISFPFFLQFPAFAAKQGLQDVYSQHSLNVQTNLLKIWHFTNDSSLSSIHPPKDDIQIPVKCDLILATPFRKGGEGDEAVKLDDLKKVNQQANYTNTILNTIAKQLNHISVRMENQNKVASNKATSTSQTPKPYNNYADNISRPFLKTDSIPKKNEESFLEASSNTNSHFLTIISDQL